eukprot:TRINITY_DN1034_c0_g1_i2.p1 TRINITY_DN1034_c0_g1~~TRINITY_DN1034_c0_g1_i2.p1  ORF type:complete len:288 (+),score=52.64 TRINITY_DN1034_c0_g1_i2:190-1053(+)
MAGAAMASGCAAPLVSPAAGVTSAKRSNGNDRRSETRAQLGCSGSLFFSPSRVLLKTSADSTTSALMIDSTMQRRSVMAFMSGISESDKRTDEGGWSSSVALQSFLCGACAALTILTAPPLAHAAQQQKVRLPPLSNEPNRCEKAFVGNTIGQANGVADKLLDLRSCDFTNEKTNLKGKSLSAALMSDAKFDNADMSEVIMSKAYAVNSSFRGTDFTSAVVDRAIFQGADMSNAIFRNTILSGSTFDDANLTGADFEDVLIGYVDAQKLCRNTTLSDDSRIILQCKN